MFYHWNSMLRNSPTDRKFLYQGKCTSMQNRKSRIQLSVHQMGVVKGSALPTGLEDYCSSLHLPPKGETGPFREAVTGERKEMWRKNTEQENIGNNNSEYVAKLVLWEIEDRMLWGHSKDRVESALNSFHQGYGRKEWLSVQEIFQWALTLPVKQL